MKDIAKPAATTTANNVPSTTSTPGTRTTTSYNVAINHIVYNDRYGNTREKEQLMDAYGNIDTERRQVITNTYADPNLSNHCSSAMSPAIAQNSTEQQRRNCSDGVVPGSNTNSNDFDYADEDATPHHTN